ncbi:MAG: CocE/NonD family hydrolase C-terminal non-catalytic domain-containing protein [Ferruginibacter sp.]
MSTNQYPSWFQKSFRGRYRNSFENQKRSFPNIITGINYTMNDVAHTFKKGHHIMVHVQSSWFPFVDRNPQKFIDIYHAKDEQFEKAAIRIYNDELNGSNIVLPILK